MQVSLQKKLGAYVIRFGSEIPDSHTSKENAVIYFNKQKSIIGFDIYPPRFNNFLCDHQEY